MLTSQSNRYTDFLVNEILPSGVVVHLDNLKLPLRDRPVEKSSSAKDVPLVSVGNASAKHPPVEPTSSHRKNDDGIHTVASSQQVMYVQPSRDKEANGTLYNDTLERDHANKSQVTRQGQRALDLQPASGPRRKEKILMRQTSSELLLVGDNEEASTEQRSTRRPLGAAGNGHKEDSGPPKPSVQLNTELVGDIKDPDDKDTPEGSRTLTQPSSTADWQAYAEVSGGFQVNFQL